MESCLYFPMANTASTGQFMLKHLITLIHFQAYDKHLHNRFGKSHLISAQCLVELCGKLLLTFYQR